MDISDGLVADLGHICEVSGVAAIVETARLPLSQAARVALKADPRLLETILTGGDDYEILFTARAVPGRLPVTQIGRIEKGQGVTCWMATARSFDSSKAGIVISDYFASRPGMVRSPTAICYQ